MSKGAPPPYPVVDADPSIARTFMNFTLSEMISVPAITAASISYGYFTTRKQLRNPCVRTCGFIGFTFAVLGSYVSSSQRLMGYDPNAKEVAAYGALTTQEALDYEYLDNYTNSESLDSADRKTRAS